MMMKIAGHFLMLLELNMRILQLFVLWLE